uniref:Coat protein n=1 Tax=Podosphaera prunicola partitivirus 3 TaxID=2052569 RepID=A0A2P0VKN4_9VIRU|nr:coat protein [Podosphaera prunicola partitivirus 3]
MSQQPPSTGSTTGPAAIGATMQAPAPTVAAPVSTPAPSVPVAPPPSKRSFAPKTYVPSSVEGPNGLSQMLSAVAEVNFSSNADLRRPNYVVPNCTIMFQVLMICDTQMSHTKRYTDANPDWHPFVSQLYISVLIYYHTLKCQSVGNQVSQQSRDFLEYLEFQFQVSHLKIPGPLVPFFQALAACSGPNDHYDNVTYGVPDQLLVSQATHYLAANRVNQHLPSVTLILDQFMRLINRFAPVGAAPAPITLDVTDSHYLDIYGVAAAAEAENAECMKCCNARNEINVALGTMQGFFGTTNLWRSVLPFSPGTNTSMYVNGNNQNVLGFDQYLGFRGIGDHSNRTYAWFREVSRIMQPYSDFFRDSVSLGSINTSGIGAIYIEAGILNTTENAQMLTSTLEVRDVRYRAPGTRRYVIPSLTELSFAYATREDGLDTVAKQLGTLCALNTLWDVNLNALSELPGPISGFIRIGPIFDRPIQYLSRVWTPLRYYSNIISGYYHVPAAGKFGP